MEEEEPGSFDELGEFVVDGVIEIIEGGIIIIDVFPNLRSIDNKMVYNNDYFIAMSRIRIRSVKYL